MNKKKIIVPLLLLLAVAVYFVVFYKDKNLRYIPENADAVVLMDVKKLTGQYLFSLAAHPSHWFGAKSKGKGSDSFKDSGISIPDFLQIFHLKNTKFSEWYTVLELKDSKKLISFLKKQNFADKGNDRFQKGQIFVIVHGSHCIAGTSDAAFEMIQKQILKASSGSVWNADQFIDHSVGSISFISGKKIQNFSIHLNDDDIEIKNTSDIEFSNSIASQLEKENHFLDVELDRENIRNLSRFFHKNIADSLQISGIKATADLEQVNDTIISYEYDDNFNEIEKKTFQKITQPDYTIAIENDNINITWEYFQSKKWINSENQFTVIPFQPNQVIRNNRGIVIKSTRKPISLSPELKENYIFVRNSALLYSSLKMLSTNEKRIISDIEFVLYGNRAKNYWVKIKAKNGELPLILRW